MCQSGANRNPWAGYHPTSPKPSGRKLITLCGLPSSLITIVVMTLFKTWYQANPIASVHISILIRTPLGAQKVTSWRVVEISTFHIGACVWCTRHGEILRLILFQWLAGNSIGLNGQQSALLKRLYLRWIALNIFFPFRLQAMLMWNLLTLSYMHFSIR